MTDGIQTLIVSVVGILATLIASASGLYFTARARSAPLRHLLYDKQLELVLDIVELIGKTRTFSILIADPSGEFSDRARQDIGRLLPRLSRLTNLAAAILPTSVFVEVSRLQFAVNDFLSNYDEGKVDNKFPEQLGAQAAKVVLLTRISLGIDELSEESLKLFGSIEGLQLVANLSADHIGAVVNDEIKTKRK